MVTDESKSQLFRLAAVLYADNNYEVTTKTIYRKVIESVLLECDKNELTIHEIIDYSQNKYGIIIDETDIVSIIYNTKQEYFYSVSRYKDTYVSLTEKRKIVLCEKISNKNIDYFIDMFGDEYQLLCQSQKYKEIIYHFLYDVFSTNTASFQKMLDNRSDLSCLINIESNKYSEEQKEIINNFLLWDNVDKNIAIFNIASYSLEYCMLTNKKENIHVRLSDLKNKKFYLDTNIIYRVLGINGENRKKRSVTFLDKFKEAGESLHISLSTNVEFKESIKFYTEKIRRYNSPRISSKIYEEFNLQTDIFDFYHKWRMGKVNTSVEIFESYIFSLYDDFVREYNIVIDNKYPFDQTSLKVKDQLKDLASGISNYKQQEGNDYIGSSLIDAENILGIECKREGRNLNIFETKYFFISTDQGLRRWDYQRVNSSPIVILPSQWMSILLRYFNCTNDDYKSFVSFLNLKSNNVIIDGDKLHIVLAGISQMTENIEHQRYLLKNLIETKFNGVIEKGVKESQIFERAKSYAKTELEKKLESIKSQFDKLSDQHGILNDNLEYVQKVTNEQIEEIRKTSSEKEAQLLQLEEENKKLKTTLKNKYVTQKMKEWKRPAYCFVSLAIIIVLFTIFQFAFKDFEYNYVYKLIVIIDNSDSETQKNTLRNLLYAPLLVLPTICCFCYSRLISSEKKNKHIAELEAFYDNLNSE